MIIILHLWDFFYLGESKLALHPRLFHCMAQQFISLGCLGSQIEAVCLPIRPWLFFVWARIYHIRRYPRPFLVGRFLLLWIQEESFICVGNQVKWVGETTRGGDQSGPVVQAVSLTCQTWCEWMRYVCWQFLFFSCQARCPSSFLAPRVDAHSLHWTAPCVSRHSCRASTIRYEISTPNRSILHKIFEILVFIMRILIFDFKCGFRFILAPRRCGSMQKIWWWVRSV